MVLCSFAMAMSSGGWDRQLAVGVWSGGGADIVPTNREPPRSVINPAAFPS